MTNRRNSTFIELRMRNNNLSYIRGMFKINCIAVAFHLLKINSEILKELLLIKIE